MFSVLFIIQSTGSFIINDLEKTDFHGNVMIDKTRKSEVLQTKLHIEWTKMGRMDIVLCIGIQI